MAQRVGLWQQACNHLTERSMVIDDGFRGTIEQLKSLVPDGRQYMAGGNLFLASESLQLGDLVQRAEDFVRAAKAPATFRAYRSDWRDFEAWSAGHHLQAVPAQPETVALYIADLATSCAAGTITRRLTAISKAHQAAGYCDSPASTRHAIVG